MRGAWFRCEVGCLAASDMVACGGQAWIWLPVELIEKRHNYIKLQQAENMFQMYTSMQFRSVVLLLAVPITVFIFYGTASYSCSFADLIHYEDNMNIILTN